MSSPSSTVVYLGWMVRYGRRMIGSSFIHTRYFVLDNLLLSYYKRKPQKQKVGDRQGLPIKSIQINANCRVEDRGLKMYHGHMLYVLCVYDQRLKSNGITMAAFNIQEALIWKEKIEMVLDQQNGTTFENVRKPSSDTEDESL